MYLDLFNNYSYSLPLIELVVSFKNRLRVIPADE